MVVGYHLLTGFVRKKVPDCISSLREEWFVLAHSWRGNSLYVGEDWWQEGEVESPQSGTEMDECWPSWPTL